MAQLPTPGADDGNWGTILNEFLQVSHGSTGLLKHLVTNVKDYGALGDGTTDDLASIHAARDAAGANGTVFLPPGMYKTSAAITPLVGQTFVGAGMHGSIILIANTASHNAFNVSVADVTIRDLQINGQRGSTVVNLSMENNCGVYVTAARCSVRECWIRDVRSTGVSVNSLGNDVKVINCRIDGGHTSNSGTTGGVNKGIFVSGADRPLVKGCSITGWSQAVGFWYGVLDGIVESNYILNNYGFEDAAHTVYRSACEDYGELQVHGRNVWSNNIIDGSTSRCFEIAQGVVGSRYVNNILRNPGIISNLGCCWEVTGATNQITSDILIQGNTCYGQTAHQDDNTINGLSYRITVANNHFIDYTFSNNSAPVFIGGTVGPESVSVIGNQFTNCRGGVRLNNNGDGIIVSHNIMRNHLGFPILLVSGNAHIIEANSIETNVGGAGITVTTGTRHRIINNRIKTVSGTPINIGTNFNLIEGNNTDSTIQGAAGIIFSSAASYNIARFNTVSGISIDARTIFFSGTADYNIVQENTILDGYLLNQSSGTHNTTEPNNTSTLTKAITTKALGTQTIGTTQVDVAHGLGYAPTVVQIMMTSAGTIWESATADATNVKLTADSAGRTAKVFVR